MRMQATHNYQEATRDGGGSLGNMSFHFSSGYPPTEAPEDEGSMWCC